MAFAPMRKFPRVFVDSSVLFAAAYSSGGSARDLLSTATQGRVGLVLSDYVLEETERNLLANAPHVHASFLRFRSNFPFQVRNPSTRLVIDTARVVVDKDAPIIAAARSSRVKWVATYDRRHLLFNREEIFAAYSITVATPEEIPTLLRLR